MNMSSKEKAEHIDELRVDLESRIDSMTMKQSTVQGLEKTIKHLEAENRRVRLSLDDSISQRNAMEKKMFEVATLASTQKVCCIG
jgi:hypothetical protein